MERCLRLEIPIDPEKFQGLETLVKMAHDVSEAVSTTGINPLDMQFSYVIHQGRAVEVMQVIP